MTISVSDYRQAVARRGAGSVLVVAPGVGVDESSGLQMAVDLSAPVGSVVDTGTVLAQSITPDAGTVTASGGSSPTPAASGGASIAQDVAGITAALAPIASTGINLGLTLAGKKPAVAQQAPAQPMSTGTKVVLGLGALGVGYGLYRLATSKKSRRR